MLRYRPPMSPMRIVWCAHNKCMHAYLFIYLLSNFPLHNNTTVFGIYLFHVDFCIRHHCLVRSVPVLRFIFEPIVHSRSSSYIMCPQSGHVLDHLQHKIRLHPGYRTVFRCIHFRVWPTSQLQLIIHNLSLEQHTVVMLFIGHSTLEVIFADF